MSSNYSRQFYQDAVDSGVAGSDHVSVLVSSFCSVGDMTSARKVLLQALKFKLDPVLDASAFDTLLEASIGAGQAEAVIDLWITMKVGFLDLPKLMTSILDSCS